MQPLHSPPSLQINTKKRKAKYTISGFVFTIHFWPGQPRAVCFSTFVILGLFSSCLGKISNHAHEAGIEEAGFS